MEKLFNDSLNNTETIKKIANYKQFYRLYGFNVILTLHSTILSVCDIFEMNYWSHENLFFWGLWFFCHCGFLKDVWEHLGFEWFWFWWDEGFGDNNMEFLGISWSGSACQVYGRTAGLRNSCKKICLESFTLQNDLDLWQIYKKKSISLLMIL